MNMNAALCCELTFLTAYKGQLEYCGQCEGRFLSVIFNPSYRQCFEFTTTLGDILEDPKSEILRLLSSGSDIQDELQTHYYQLTKR